MRGAGRRKFQIVVTYAFRLFARNARHLILTLDELRSLDVDFVSYKEALDTSTSSGREILRIIGSMAELERSTVRDRVNAGLDHARNYGTKSGRPWGRPRSAFDREKVVRLRKAGWSLRRIAQEMGIGLGTVTRTLEAAL